MTADPKPVPVEIDDWVIRGFTGSQANRNGARQLTIRIGPSTVERIVPPAGEAHAFERTVWNHEITVYVSPTGRSVRVWLDNDEVRP